MSQPTDLHTLAGAYALDALTEIERAGFARHVASCEACATEVTEFSETASRLSAPAWEAPPAQLREAVLAEVAQTHQVTAGRSGRTAHADVPGGGRVTVAISPSRNDGVVVMSDLPAPPEGKVYQLWLIDGSSPTSAGVMVAGQRSGTATLSSVRGADTLGVTLEPEGGSPPRRCPRSLALP